ncbi:DUF1330 domain-containing protein [Aureivirga sp. CE67]|uniref:DUF1330 domain-containing protein n=1 Tax=Aureivirga sp. CE67 TaxID=1788983 RepID=UPI0018C9CB66|nr:DUF1330 domain-containing protein [Aureivirga sp. CE67]
MENSKKIIPAYFIGSSFMPEGHGSLMPYGEAAHAIIEREGGELIIAGHTDQNLIHFEGEWKKDARLTVFKFPSMEHLMRFWNSPEYQAIKHLRTDVIPPNFTFATEGYDPSLFSYEQ